MSALLPSYGTATARNGQAYLDQWRDAIPAEWRLDEPREAYQPPSVSPTAVGVAAAGGALSLGISTGLPGALIGALAGLMYKPWGWKTGATIGGVAGLLLGSTLGAAGGVVAATERTKWR